MAYFQTAKQAASLLTLALCLVAVPFVTNDFRAYQLGTYLLYGVVAQGVALVWGRLGFLPLGQALFFGLGAYVAGLLFIHAQDNALLYLLLPLSILVPALLAYLVARLVFAGQYVSGPDFSLITLAFTMLGAQLANQFTGLSGGFNGLANIPQLGDLDRYSSMYFLIVALVLFSTALLSWLYQTPLGTLWLAISQNENRLQFFGFATDKLKAGAFALSAALAGSAGFLYAAQQGLVTPQAIGFQLSAELVIWTAVGGRFGPYGALLGAVGIGLLSSDLREIWVHWEVLVALLFIAVVFDALTVSENLNLRQRNLDACQAFFYSFPLVRQRRNQKSGVLSGGEKKLVSFVRVMAEGADLTVMDEPTEGVQQENIALMAAHVRQRCEQGASFIIAEQNLTFLLSVMHQVLVLDNGETVFQSDAFDREGLEQFLRI